MWAQSNAQWFVCATSVCIALIFGPPKSPEIGQSLGKALKGFQKASNEFQKEIKKEMESLEKAAKMQVSHASHRN